jgi:hypothetical protein
VAALLAHAAGACFAAQVVLVLSGVLVARTEVDRRIVVALAIIVAGGTVIVAAG